MNGILHEKARQRVESRVRPDEELLRLVGYERSMYPGGDGQVRPGPSGILGVTDLRVIHAEAGGTRNDTSYPHPTTVGAQVRTKIVGLSILTLNAGPLGVVALFGGRHEMRSLAETINGLAGKEIPEQPLSCLVPDFPPSALICKQCQVPQQHHRWDTEPTFCHGCLRTFAWTDGERERVAELRTCFDENASIIQLPQHLQEWALQEYRERMK
ncbi:hypothetical protein OG896_24625 [Streptomyces sp. NBC_00669]|uniref:hypothetical protein n=1 Tax=Streptomyces sp. NBC_00669 TaxID=2976011 RepID=UPI002E2EF3F1|nr:hypothetical protein [Streptomyces sp. NBC_00669]